MFTPSAKERVEAAEQVGVHEQYLYQWLSGRREVPSERCHAIEAAFRGAITCEELRPDIVWARITDPDWPWHPAGRPAIDVTVRARQGAEAVADGVGLHALNAAPQLSRGEPLSIALCVPPEGVAKLSNQTTGAAS